jgi:hypothetical protein
VLAAEESIVGHLLLMTSRELIDGLVAPHDTMEVPPLGIAETRELVGGLLTRPSADTVFAISDRSDGVPLFAEELCMRADPQDTSVPDTLEAVLSSRVDRLDADALHVAQQMAVVGQDVSRLALSELAELNFDRLDEAIQHLLAHRIVVTAPVATAPTFRFRHALVRDVVYDSMLTAARRASHGRWASILAALVAAGEPIRPELIAEHYSAAGDGGAALTWWRRAGERAAAAAAHLEAASHFEHALTIVRTQEVGTARDLQEFELELQLGLSRSASEGYASPAAFDAFMAAGALTDRLPRLPALIPAIWGLWSFHLIRGDMRAADALIDQCQAFAETGDAGERDLVEAIAGTQRLFEGDFEAAVRALEAGKRSAGPAALLIPQDPSLASQCQLSIALWHCGRTIAARAEMDACLAEADRDESSRADFNQAYVYSYAAWLHELAGASQRALEFALVAGEVATRRHFATWQVAAQLHAACARSSLGSPTDAIEAMTIGLSYWRDLGGATLMVPYFLARRGWAHLAAGDVEAALLDASDGLSLSAATGQGFHDVELLRLLASAEHAGGAPRPRWLDPLAHAAATAVRQGAPMLAARVVITAHELDGDSIDPSLDVALAALSDLDADDNDPTIARLAARGLATQDALP